MAKYDGWLEDPGGLLRPIPDTASDCASAIRMLDGQRVYERSYKRRTDNKWVYRYLMTEPPKGTDQESLDVIEESVKTEV